MFLTRKQIIEANDRPIEVVQVPEWGGSVGVRAMSAVERGKLEELISNGRIEQHQLRELMTVMTVCNKQGDLLFTEADIEVLSAKSGAALDRVFKKAQELAGWSTTAVSEAEADLDENPS